jgi:hypothetical protein
MERDFAVHYANGDWSFHREAALLGFDPMQSTCQASVYRAERWLAENRTAIVDRARLFILDQLGRLTPLIKQRPRHVGIDGVVIANYGRSKKGRQRALKNRDRADPLHARIGDHADYGHAPTNQFYGKSVKRQAKLEKADAKHKRKKIALGRVTLVSVDGFFGAPVHH